MREEEEEEAMHITPSDDGDGDGDEEKQSLGNSAPHSAMRHPLPCSVCGTLHMKVVSWSRLSTYCLLFIVSTLRHIHPYTQIHNAFIYCQQFQ